MKEILILTLYRSLLPILFIIAFPSWLLKMIKRGGFKTALQERIGIYTTNLISEPSNAIHIHSISVGETIIAIKLIRLWQQLHPQTKFVLATGTSTGHQTASQAQLPYTRITYSPLDFTSSIRSYLNRFKPSQIILIEGDIWPNLLRLAKQRNIPISLANARSSPRSSKRLLHFKKILQPFFSKISLVCIQEKEHQTLWENLGIPTHNIHLTGSIKFDPLSSSPPTPRPDFAQMINHFGSNRPVILAASTFPGEELLIASAIKNSHPNALPIIVPRHAERRNEVTHTLSKAGFHVTLRSNFSPPKTTSNNIFLIDSTGELPTWITHAHTVIIGKSFLSTGGQNPAEAIIALKPLILGPHMENFQPLANTLLSNNAALLAHDLPSITLAIQKTLNPSTSSSLTQNASRILDLHKGATLRHLNILHTSTKPASISPTPSTLS